MNVIDRLQGTVRADGVSSRVETTTLLLPTTVHADPGQCVVLRGPNGSGKTTLLRIMAGLLEPTEGQVTIGGVVSDERDRSIRAAVAALLGVPTTYRDLTLIDHLVLVDSTWGGDPDTSEDRGRAMLSRFGIAGLDDRFPSELSSGQEQLFRLALTFTRPCSVLLLDEPEQRLDTAKRGVLGDVILERVAAGTAVILASHDPALTERVADLVVDIVPAGIDP